MLRRHAHDRPHRVTRGTQRRNDGRHLYGIRTRPHDDEYFEGSGYGGAPAITDMPACATLSDAMPPESKNATMPSAAHNA